MNVSSQNLRRRQSLSVPGAPGGALHGRPLKPLRRVGPTFRKRPRSSLDGNPADASSSANNDEGDGASSRGGKGRRAFRDASSSSSNDARPRIKTRTPILEGVVACLSGQDEDVKRRVQRVVSELGGSTMGRFDPRYVTHLVLDAPEGSKYENWRRHRSGEGKHAWAERLKVVTTSWVDACERKGRRVSEEAHKLREENVVAGAGGKAPEERGQSLPEEIRRASPEEKCDWMIEQQPVDKYRYLFSSQSFILVGFDTDDDNNVGNGEGNDCREVPVEGSRAAHAGDGEDGLSNKVSIRRKNESETLKGRVSKLIRRAGGTIFWEPNEWITVVLLNDGYSKHSWDDVRYFCREHPRGPVCVGVDWVLASIYHRTYIAPPPFPAEPRPEMNVQKAKQNVRGSVGSVGSTNTGSLASISKKSKQPTTSLFRGDVFTVVPTKPMPGTLDFCLEDMESTIVNNGGLLLSKTLLLAIKKGARSAPTVNANPDRKYYIVTSRWLQLDCATSFPLLAELAKVGIKVLPVSPVWVAACTLNNYRHDPEGYPTLFQPQTWPIRLWNPTPEDGAKVKILISVTGFVDSSRYGIVSMLKQIGAEFTDNLSRRNTHLICKEAKGMKYAKALEWGLHAVSLEWLYHVIRYGYDEGSEEKFSLVAKKVPVKMQQTATAPKAERVRSSSDVKVDVPLNGKKYDNKAFEPAEHEAATTSNAASKRAIGFASEIAKDMDRADAERATESSSSSHSSPRRRGKRDPPQASPGDRDPPQSSRGDDPRKRLHFALRALEGTENNRNPSRSPRRRGKRDRSPMKATQQSVSLLSRPSEDEEEEEGTQMETQLTTGTIRANADIFGGMLSKKGRCGGGGDSSEVPLSQVNDAEDNGESQVVWFAAPRG